MARRKLLKLARTSVPHFCHNIHRQSLVRSPVFCLVSPLIRPLAVSRGSCRGRALQRPHILHPISPKSSNVHLHPCGLQHMNQRSQIRNTPSPQHRSVAVNHVPSGLFGFAAQDLNNAATYSSSSKLTLGVGALRFDLIW